MKILRNEYYIATYWLIFVTSSFHLRYKNIWERPISGTQQADSEYICA